MNNDTAIVLMLADRQRDIEALRAEVERLQQDVRPALPDGADGWSLPNGRRVYPAVDGGFAAADEGGWLDGTRSTVAAWATSD